MIYNTQPNITQYACYIQKCVQTEKNAIYYLLIDCWPYFLYASYTLIIFRRDKFVRFSHWPRRVIYVFRCNTGVEEIRTLAKHAKIL